MVSTVLTLKPKPADSPAEEASVEVDEETKENRCCRKKLWWSVAKFLVSLALLSFFSLILAGQAFGLYSVMDTYDTHVETYIEYPLNITLPAVTVCNNNAIQQSKFCAKFPEYCSNKTDGEKKLDLARSEDWKLVKNMTTQEVTELGQEWADLVPSCARVSSDSPNTDCREASRIFYKGLNCFTFLAGPNQFTGDYRKSGLWLSVNFQGSEYTNSMVSVGGRIFVHDTTKRIPDGFPTTGHRIKPGNQYKVLLKKISHNRLPAPFDTNCRHYPTDGQITSQKECYNECVFKSFVNQCGCMPDYLPHVHPRLAYDDCPVPCNQTRQCLNRHEKNNRDEIESLCDDQCPIACLEDQYEVNIEAAEVPNYNEDIKKAKSSQSYVWVAFESNEHKTYMYNSITEDIDISATINIICLYCLVVLVLLGLTLKTMVDICTSCKKNQK